MGRFRCLTVLDLTFRVENKFPVRPSSPVIVLGEARVLAVGAVGLMGLIIDSNIRWSRRNPINLVIPAVVRRVLESTLTGKRIAPNTVDLDGRLKGIWLLAEQGC